MDVSSPLYFLSFNWAHKGDSDETMMTIHFNANLRPIVKNGVGMLHWIADPACSGFIIAYDLDGNQVLISNFDVSRSILVTPKASLLTEIIRTSRKDILWKHGRKNSHMPQCRPR